MFFYQKEMCIFLAQITLLEILTSLEILAIFGWHCSAPARKYDASDQSQLDIS